MPRRKASQNDLYDPEPRWPALVAVLAVAGLYFALPRALVVGPRWLFPAAIIVLVIPTMITHARKLHSMNSILGFSVSALVTVGMIASVVLLVMALPEHKE